MFFALTTVWGQALTTQFEPAAVTSPVGSTFDLNLKVTGFTNIGTFQLPVTFSKAILELTGVSNLATLPSFNAGSHTTLAIANNVAGTTGRITFSWQADPQTNASGSTLADGAILFTLTFRVKASGTSTVNVANSGAGIEVTRAPALSTVTVNYQTGGASITAGSGTTGPTPLVGFKIVANTVYIPAGQIGCMPVTVNDFTGIQSLQFATHFNPAVLRFDCVRNLNLPGWSSSEIVADNVTGLIKSAWGTPSGTGVSRPNGSALYEVCFKAIGTAGASNVIIIDGNGFAAEAINDGGTDLATAGFGVADTLFLNPSPMPATAITMTADTGSTTVNTPFCVGVKVKNFTGMTAVELPMSFDAGVLNYQSIDLGANPLGLATGALPNANFSQSSGLVKFVWANSTGVTLPDNTNIFSVCLSPNATATVGSTIPVTLGSSAACTPVGVQRKDVGARPVALVAGSIRLKSAPSVVLGVPTVQNVACNGGANGSVSVSPTGCSGQYTYAWASTVPGFATVNAPALTGQKAGTYTVTVTCATGGTATATATIAQPSWTLSIPTPVVTDANCPGTGGGGITLAPTGSPASYNYSWTGPGSFTSAAGPTLMNLRSGAYTVTVTETSASCSTTATVTVNAATNTLNLSQAKVDANCSGTMGGSITITPSGGNTPFSYAWAGPSNASNNITPTLTNIGQGIYSVTVTDNKSCTSTATVQVNRKLSTVNIPTPVTVRPACSGTNGSITLSPAGGVAPYTYAWNPGGNANPLNNLGAGNYFVTVQDAEGCSATTTVTLSSTTSTISAGTPVVSESPYFAPATGSIALSPSGGKTPYTVTWSGPSGSTHTGLSLTALIPGDYVPVIRDADGCVFTAPAVKVTGPAEALALASNPVVTSPLCAGDATGTIAIVAKGGNGGYRYAWASTVSPFPTVDNPNLSNLKGGTYTVTITDSRNCTFSAPVTVAERPPIQPTASASGCGAISLTVTGGTGAYTYIWAGPNNFTASTQNIAGLQAGTYTATVRDANNCSAVTQPVALSANNAGPTVSATAVNSKCHNDTNGGATLVVSNNPADNTYRWYNINDGTLTVSTVQNPNNLAPGVYNVVVTDNITKCSTSLTQNVTVGGPNSPLVVTPGTITASPCPETPGGAIQMSANGGWGQPFTAVWSGSTPPLPSQLNQPAAAPGTYTVSVTDAGGCTVTNTVVVPGPDSILITKAQVDSVTCAGVADGRISLTIKGGNGGAYSVVWSGGSNLAGETISNLSGKKFYTPTVSDRNGCTKVFGPIYLHEPDTLNIKAAITKQSATATNGAIDLTVAGGTKPLKFQWSGGSTATTEDLTGLVAGTYTVLITDKKGCIVTETFKVELDNALPQTIWTIKNACGTSRDGSVEFSIPPSVVGPFRFKWTASNGVTGELTSPNRTVLIGGLGADSYAFTITDISSSFSFPPNNPNPIVVSTLPPAIFGVSEKEPDGASKNGFIILSSSEPLTYRWNDGSTAPARVNLDSGIYIVKATHVISGCMTSDTFRLKRNWPAFTTAEDLAKTKDETCLGKSDGAIGVLTTGGNPAQYIYNWSGPNGFSANTATISGLAAGFYDLTITDGDGTTITYTKNIKTLSQLKVTNVTETSNYNNYQVSGSDKCDGAATVIFTGQSGAASISWSNGATGVSTNTLCAGPYTVTVTDGVGCTSVWNDELTAPVALTAVAQTSKSISCFGKCDATGRVTATGGVAPYRVSWALRRNDVLNAPGDSSVIQNLCPGAYAVTVTDKNNVTQTFTVNIAKRDSIVVEISDDVQPTSFSNCDGELLAVAVGTVGAVTYTWSSNIGHRGESQRAENLCAGEVVSFIIIDANGCRTVATDTVPNPSDGCLEARPVITPDERDGRNDEFIIGCIEEYQNTVEIFNRWGQLIFETTNYNNTSNYWDGLSKSGDSLPEGVYFYVITFTDGNGQKRQIKGYVNLLR